MYNKCILFLYKISVEYLVQDVIIILSTNNKALWQLKNKGFTLFSITAIIIVTINNVAIKRGGDDMEVLEMTDKELITITMDRFAELQRIKRDNGDHENKELDYAIKLTTAKLSSLGVNVEDITL